MNDQTPRRYRGTLLERAAEQLRYAPVTPLNEPTVQRRVTPTVPLVVPDEPVQPEMRVQPDGVNVEREPVRGPEPATAPVPISVPAPVAAPVYKPEPLSVADPKPAPATAPAPIPEPAARHDGRRILPIDRELLAEGGMIVPGAAITSLAEEFRMVKRQLLLTARAVAAAETAKAGDKARMILVCSAQANEGKTFCAINLALSMAAEKDFEILLVDADFAKPDVLDRLGLPAGPGLLDVLSGTVANVEDCIVDTDVPQLSVLPAGARTHADTELLASDRARALLDGLATANPRRIVIFDSPPALAASPASVLALHVGQAMLVVRADQTSESDLREAVNTLDGCEHIQLILNSVSLQPGGRRFGSYYEETGK